MAKKPTKHVDTPAKEAEVQAASTEAVTKEKTIGVRGPKGVALDAKITVLAGSNPKRQGSKAAVVFAKYVDGMSVQAFLDAAGDEATPNLVYDSKHGFIAIEGYAVSVIPPKEKKAPKAKAEPKAKKEKAPKNEEAAAVEAELAAETVEEAA
jgi:hypothetical protein